jgi:hypothetical protein
VTIEEPIQNKAGKKENPTENENNGLSASGKAIKKDSKSHVDTEAFRPTTKGRGWSISELDLDWISTGCYVLGTGGGGSPYSNMLRWRPILGVGGVIRVINPNDLKDDDFVGCGGGAGSPAVGIEKLHGDNYVVPLLKFTSKYCHEHDWQNSSEWLKHRLSYIQP